MAGCYGDATHDYSVCLYENAFFTPEMCPNAPEAKAVCDAAFDSCSAIANSIEDPQEAMALAAQCWDSYNTCVSKSGYWQCQ